MARSAVAFGICVAVELSQLVHTPAIDAVRRTALGQLVLGSGFDARDLVAYAAGVSVAALLERIVRRPRLSAHAIVVFAVVCAGNDLSAQAAVWQPSPGHAQLPIWPGVPPHAQQAPGPEIVTTTGNDHLVAGRPWAYISNVSRPTLTVYSPTGKNTGAAVIVFPGGGYQILAIDLEGTEVCDWLTSKGITCVLLKYRVPNTGQAWNQPCGCDLRTGSSRPLEDAQRTVGLVRFHAAEWGIDPHRIGVLGFSAGGHLVAAVSTHFTRRDYPAVDSADRESSRPDFVVALYPGHLYDYDKDELFRDIHITRDTPPTFVLQAENDNVDGPSNSLIYYTALKDAGVPAELHLYPEGGHAFGLRRTKFPITQWPQLVERWLQAIGMIAP
jgi:acetyl esterase/lipase